MRQSSPDLSAAARTGRGRFLGGGRGRERLLLWPRPQGGPPPGPVSRPATLPAARRQQSRRHSAASMEQRLAAFRAARRTLADRPGPAKPPAEAAAPATEQAQAQLRPPAEVGDTHAGSHACSRGSKAAPRPFSGRGRSAEAGCALGRLLPRRLAVPSIHPRFEGRFTRAVELRVTSRWPRPAS